MTATLPLESVDFTKAGGLICAIAQDYATQQVLMVAWMDPAALAETIATGRAVYYSRSRKRLWRKGEESGHVQLVRAIRLDCDGDAVLLSVEQVGGVACHEGYASCFTRRLAGDHWEREGEPLVDPAAIYRK